eukprot:6214260-Pleurochrysis_carterae.AAC.1
MERHHLLFSSDPLTLAEAKVRLGPSPGKPRGGLFLPASDDPPWDVEGGNGESKPLVDGSTLGGGGRGEARSLSAWAALLASCARRCSLCRARMAAIGCDIHSGWSLARDVSVVAPVLCGAVVLQTEAVAFQVVEAELV